MLDDETVDALHSFLLDLLTQFENHYFGQLHCHQQDLETIRRKAYEPVKQRATRAASDPKLNDDISF